MNKQIKTELFLLFDAILKYWQKQKKKKKIFVINI